MKGTALFCLLVLFACKSKSKSTDQPGSASGTAVVAADAAPAKNTVTVPAGPVKFGCIGWNATTKSAACITGEDAAGEEPRYQIDYIMGSDPATVLPVKDGNFGDLKAANETLARLGMEPFPTPVKTVKSPEPGDTDLGNGAKLVWSEKITAEGGDNQAPTTLYEASVTCANGQKVEIEKIEQEGIDLDFYIWQVPGFVIIEQHTHIGREGESRNHRKVGHLELATCKFVNDEA